MRRNPAIEAAYSEVSVACFEWAFDGRTDMPPLAAAEADSIAGAVPTRQREFAVGRACAHAALEAIGHPTETIPRLDDRSPGWPPGVTGSISHTHEYGVAVAAAADHHRIGIDVESWGRVDDGVAAIVSVASDRATIADATGLDEPDATTVAFAAKEAFYKAQYAWTASFVEFHEVRIATAESTAPEELRLRIEPVPGLVPIVAWPVEVRALLGDRRVVAAAVVTPAV